MCGSSKGLLKRVIPFFLTFGAGLLIASFFVPLAGFSMPFGKGKRHRECDRRRDAEIRQLKDKVAEQEETIRQLREGSIDWHMNMDVPPVAGSNEVFVPPQPPPPPAPVAKGHR